MHIATLILIGSGVASADDSKRAVADASTPSEIDIPLTQAIDENARRYGLDPALAHALIRAESAYERSAVSSAGALGLMQVMPETAADYGVNDPQRLFEPQVNLDTGMRHFKRLLDKYDSIGAAVMAYNAGEGALERGDAARYPETRFYTHQVLTRYLRAKGVDPYSDEGRALVGIALTPEMARAAPSPSPAQSSVRPEPWRDDVQRPALKSALRAPIQKTARLAASTPRIRESSLRVARPSYIVDPRR